MKKFFTPGPSGMYPTVQDHVQTALEAHIPSISHRSQAFKDMYGETTDALRAVFHLPPDWGVLFFASATEIWERLIQNCVDTHSFHFVNGSFSQRFYDAAHKLHRHPQKVEAEWGHGFDRVAIPAEVEMINFTRNETSTGVMTPPEFIYSYRQKNPEALLTVDMVSSAPYTDWDWDQIDAAYFSVQKAFGLPAGLGVLLHNPRILERAEQRKAKGKSLGTYHDFLEMAKKASQNQTVETPNAVAIYLLGKVCQDMLAKGVDSLRREIHQRADSLYSYFEKHPRWKPFVKEHSHRSQTVIVVDIPEGSASLIGHLSQQGLIVGDGYGKMKGKQLRIANFPATSQEDMRRLLTELDKIS